MRPKSASQGSLSEGVRTSDRAGRTACLKQTTVFGVFSKGATGLDGAFPW